MLSVAELRAARALVSYQLVSNYDRRIPVIAKIENDYVENNYTVHIALYSLLFVGDYYPYLA